MLPLVTTAVTHLISSAPESKWTPTIILCWEMQAGPSMVASVTLVQWGTANSLKHGAVVSGTFFLLFNPEVP